MIPPRKASDAYLVTPPTSINNIPLIPLPVEPIKKTGSTPVPPLPETCGLYIAGDLAEFFDYFRKFSSWDQCMSTITNEPHQWLGPPKVSGLIMKDRNQNINLSIKNGEITLL